MFNYVPEYNQVKLCQQVLRAQLFKTTVHRHSEARLADTSRYRVGLHHLAFEAASRGAVDERAEWLGRQGAEIESGPEEYAYIPGYYAVFFYDPDGIKLEIVHVPALAA